MDKLVFPQGFKWGVATSATQIEGAVREDGKGFNIWDIFSFIPGKIITGETTQPANDFYHTFKSDIQIMKQMNLNSYRFSTSWSRILPEGRGKVNQKGLDFYHRVIDELLKNNIMPNITLYHWDLPSELENYGGWLNRDIADWFGDYAYLVFKEFSDKVPMFATINEPIATYVGYAMGIFPPGKKLEKFGRDANHNVLRAHGTAVKAFRAINPKNSNVGIVMDIWNKMPARENDRGDIDKAILLNETTHLGYLNPIFKGKYSDIHLNWMKENNCMPIIEGGDMQLINQKIDFFGLNCYGRVVTSTDREEARKVVESKGGNFQHEGQEHYPQAMYDVLKMLKEDFTYDLPLYITENGFYQENEQIVNGQVHDIARIKCIKDYLKQIHKAIEDGIDVRGYYAWTLFDNWEWTAGSSYQFGLIKNNFKTQERTWKDSAYWYSNVIKNNGIID